MKIQFRRAIGVVGSDGFIGKHLVRALGQSGFLVLNFNSKSLPLDRVGNLNETLLQVDSLIWCASRVNPRIADSSPEIVASELEEWKTFISLWKRNSCARPIPIIFISSGGCVYNGHQVPFTETSESTGINAYGIMKSRMERILIDAEIPFKILRAANVYGPGQSVGRGQGVLAEWVNAINGNKAVEVYGSLDSFRDFIYVDDFVSGIFSCIRYPEIDGVFNIGSGKPTTLQEVLEKLSKLSSRTFMITRHQARSIDREGYYLDINKALTSLRWQPNIDLDEGLQNCLE